MSIITRSRNILMKKNCLAKEVTSISLDEKRITLLCEEIDKKEIQLWHVINLIEKKGNLEEYSDAEKKEHQLERNLLCKNKKKPLELAQSQSGVLDVFVPFCDKEIEELSLFFKDRQNIDYPQQYFIYDWQEEQSFGTDLFIQTEYLEPLGHIQKYEKLKEKDVIGIGIQMTKALCMYHNMGISFVALSPSHIGRTKDGTYKLSPENWNFEHNKYSQDSIGYAALEEIQFNQYDERSDIYRLGLILYELCNHNKRFHSLNWYPSEQEWLDKIELKSSLTNEIGISRQFFEVLKKACANQLDERYQNVQELRNALNECQEDENSKLAEKYLAEGKRYYYGNGVPQNYTEALKWYLKAAELGNIESYNRIGVMYYHGYVVKKDEKEAVKWYTRASENGNMYAQYNLGWSYQYGSGVEKDNFLAFMWYKRSAEQGYIPSQVAIGRFYFEGKVVEQSDTEAFKWFKKAAEQGHIAAQNYVGFCYYNGRGVEQSDTEAFKWFKKSADKDDSEAQCYIGLMHYNGRGVEQSDTEAFKWFKKSAVKGYSYGQYNLGTMYYVGRSVEKDIKLAKFWYGKAAEQGNTYAKKILEKIEK